MDFDIIMVLFLLETSLEKKLIYYLVMCVWQLKCASW